MLLDLRYWSIIRPSSLGMTAKVARHAGQEGILLCNRGVVAITSLSLSLSEGSVCPLFSHLSCLRLGLCAHTRTYSGLSSLLPSPRKPRGYGGHHHPSIHPFPTVLGWAAARQAELVLHRVARGHSKRLASWFSVSLVTHCRPCMSRPSVCVCLYVREYARARARVCACMCIQ